MKIAKSYKEYRKIIRKYRKYEITDKRFPKVCYNIYTDEQVKEVYNYVKHWDGCTYQNVLENFHNLRGHLVYSDDLEDVFIVKGIIDEYCCDILYIMEDANGEIWYGETEYTELLNKSIYDNPDKRYSAETVNHLIKFKEMLNGKCQIS